MGRRDQVEPQGLDQLEAVSYTHLRAHETVLDLVCRLLLEQNNHPIELSGDSTNVCIRHYTTNSADS